jgi:adenine-specific DNA-methyltransferase
MKRLKKALQTDILPSKMAEELARAYLKGITRDEKKNLGQFVTPYEVAAFAARQVKISKASIKILDPGAGSGILSCALVEHLLANRPRAIKEIHLTAFEIDPLLCAVLRKVMGKLIHYGRSFDCNIIVKIHCKDFLKSSLANIQKQRSNPDIQTRFDLVICNPPYNKLATSHDVSAELSSLFDGQGNVYACFMAVAATILRENGQMIFIVPRSFAAGVQFRKFRQTFFRLMLLEFVHAFMSRSKNFADGVLQENIIISARRAPTTETLSNHLVVLSSSDGIADLTLRTERQFYIEELMDSENRLLLPVSDAETDAVDLIQHWPETLSSLNVRVSTGPVVPFRSTRYLSDKSSRAVPLIWMQHVKAMALTFPIRGLKKKQWIKLSTAKAKPQTLLENRNLVIIRRFTFGSKNRRFLTAAPWFARDFPFPRFGLENHLNYLYRVEGELTEDETFGFAAVLNSAVCTSYMRALNSNTQIGAKELMQIPQPHLSVIIKVGQIYKATRNMDLVNDALMSDLLKLQMAFAAKSFV